MTISVPIHFTNGECKSRLPDLSPPLHDDPDRSLDISSSNATLLKTDQEQHAAQFLFPLDYKAMDGASCSDTSRFPSSAASCMNVQISQIFWILRPAYPCTNLTLHTDAEDFRDLLRCIIGNLL